MTTLGNLVKIKELKKYAFGRGSVGIESIGVVVKRRKGISTKIYVVFCEQIWKGRENEVEVVREGIMIGDLVQLNPNNGHKFCTTRDDICDHSIGVVWNTDGVEFFVDFPEHHGWRGTLGDLLPAWRPFRLRELVRANPLTENAPQTTHAGQITELHTDRTVTTDFASFGLWRGSPHDLAPVLCVSSASGVMTRFIVGQKVKGVRGFGIIAAVRRDRTFLVDSSRGSRFTAHANELRLVQHAFTPGDEVFLNPHISRPLLSDFSFPAASPGVVTRVASNGVISVRFAEGTWRGLEAELIPPSFVVLPGHFEVGDKVRAGSASPGAPNTGTHPGGIGVVSLVADREDGQLVVVEFPQNPSWQGRATDFRPAEHDFKVGDIVRANSYRLAAAPLVGVGRVKRIEENSVIWVQWTGGESAFVGADLLPV
eukprot:gnl/Chilomastix_cuspidata/433.p3 GENE.gnl/Chilomastix_cuspidata/433~~gnl/Chilomastix_cuspidata/433.p3  ORF type:complete len:426 (+),score=191.90 gnl/Chilomastix_cuspidata/433:5396-6673(+)